MATAAGYQTKIGVMDQAALFELWVQIQDRITPGWDAGMAFEYLVLRAFELEGASVTYPYMVEVQGEIAEQIDGVVHLDAFSALIESKDHEASVSIGSIAKLRNQLLRRPSPSIGMIFSRSGFTTSAQVLSQYLAPQTILLWNGPEIELALRRRKMIPGAVLKYRKAVELGQPDFNLLTSGAL